MPRRSGSRVRLGLVALLVLLTVGAPPPNSAVAAGQTTANWTMYHANPARTGYVADMPDPTRLAKLWTTRLDGAVYAEPLVVNGLVVVATENDSLYALDAATGRVRWRRSVGTPVPRSVLPCGDVSPLGITGTPVYDPRTGLVFAAAEVTGPAHILVGVDVKSGRLMVRRSLDPPGMPPLAYQQRSALALEGTRVYATFGGLDGDCGDYHGLVVASSTNGKGALLSYQVPTTREGGIWEPSGPVIDAQGNLYVTVGNGAATGGPWDHSDSVLRLSPTLRLEDAFAPTSWASDNAADLDLSSMGPILLPNGLLYANGKSGQGYLLRAQHLGGIGGQLTTLSFCRPFGGAAVRGRAVYIPCSTGLRQLTVTAGSRLIAGWQAPPVVIGSPVVGGQTVYCLAPSGTLYAFDAATGHVRATLAVGLTYDWTTPTLSGRSIFIGTWGGVVAVGIR